MYITSFIGYFLVVLLESEEILTGRQVILQQGHNAQEHLAGLLLNDFREVHHVDAVFLPKAYVQELDYLLHDIYPVFVLDVVAAALLGELALGFTFGGLVHPQQALVDVRYRDVW